MKVETIIRTLRKMVKDGEIERSSRGMVRFRFTEKGIARINDPRIRDDAEYCPICVVAFGRVPENYSIYNMEYRRLLRPLKINPKDGVELATSADRVREKYSERLRRIGI